MREGWRELAADLLAERLKFLDESGSNLALTRLYGRAAPGERVSEGVPQNYGENVTLLAAIGVGGLQAPMTVNGAVDGAVFLTWGCLRIRAARQATTSKSSPLTPRPSGNIFSPSTGSLAGGCFAGLTSLFPVRTAPGARPAALPATRPPPGAAGAGEVVRSRAKSVEEET